MPTREQVLLTLRQRDGYDAVGQALGVPAGQAYLVATGLPADGSDAAVDLGGPRAGTLEGSTQHLVYRHLPPRNPTTKPEVHRWIKQLAEADAPMQAAARQRDALPGEPLEPEVTDILTVLTRQHDQVTALIQQLKTIPGVTKGGSEVHQSRRGSIVDVITVELSKHEATEEEHFWPWVRSVLDDGDDRAATALEQEQQGKEILTQLGRTPPSAEEFDDLAEQLESAARKHVAFEDRVLLALAQCTDEEQRRQVGERFVRAHRHAPTRPHRHAPKEPGVAVKTAGAAGAAMDRVRDKVGDRPAKRRGRAEHEPDLPAGHDSESEE